MGEEWLSIYSHNARRLNNSKKKRAVLNKFRQGYSNVLLIKETHSVFDIELVVHAEWGSKNVLFSHGTSNSRGVCLLWKKGIKCDKVFVDNEGRMLIVKVTVNNNSYY